MVLGIDPGAKGAFAVYDTTTRRIVGDVEDCPLWYQTVGKRKRLRVDTLALADMFDTYAMMGVELIVMEAVGGRGLTTKDSERRAWQATATRTGCGISI